MELVNRLIVNSTGGRVRPAGDPGPLGSVSVVIPCYNYGHYLRACVASVIAGNDNLAIEIIIVDDCSTDDSLSVARQLEHEDRRIRVIANERNIRHIATYNKGLAEVTGDAVVLLSADDLLTPGSLTRAAAFFAAEPDVGLVYGRTIDFQGTPPACSPSAAPHWYVWKGRDWLRARCEAGYNVVPTPSVAMRTSVLRRIGGYRPELPHTGDFEMWLRAAAVADIGFVAEVQAFYRIHVVNMHKQAFLSGTEEGGIIDMRERWDAFRLMFEAMAGEVAELPALETAARRSLAASALGHMSHACARGKRNFPFADYEAFAAGIYPAYKTLPQARALARRRALVSAPIPLRPLLVPSAALSRLSGEFMKYRRLEVGV